MLFYAYHEAKSKYAYMYDKDTVHLRLKVSADFAETVEVLFGDPFNWGPSPSDSSKWEWLQEAKEPLYMEKEASFDGMDHFFASVKPLTKRMKYTFIINGRYMVSMRGTIDLEETPLLKGNLFYYYNYPFLNEEDLFHAPSWVKDQVWYSIFPERFKNGDSSLDKGEVLSWGETDHYTNHMKFGGDLAGIIESLPYLQQIGFTGIYMTPIFVSDSNHKYDIRDYFHIDPAFGTNETFGKLVERAHQLGMKVMLDAVFNHCGFRHPFFQDVIEKGKDSIYYNGFFILDDSKPVIDNTYCLGEKLSGDIAKEIFQNRSLLNYRTFAFTPYMPKLNTNHPLIKKHLLEVASYWIKEYDIDGWRLDVSNEVGHCFWRDFRRTVKEAKPEAYIVGENWDDSYPWLLGDQYDAVMNYGYLYPIWDFFGVKEDGTHLSSEIFMNQINRVNTMYPRNVLESMYNLVDSHDTTRIIEICGNQLDLAKLPYVFMFSLPGSPSIYYGGEVGLSGKHDPDNRRCMLWGEKQNKSFLSFVKQMIYLRKEVKELKSVHFKFLPPDQNAIFIQKEQVYVILFNEESPREVVLPKELIGKKMLDLYHDEIIHLEERLFFKRYDFMILKEV